MALNLSEPSWRDVCGLWLADRSRTCAHRTLVAYEKSARLTLVPALGHLPAGSITRQHVQAMHLEAVSLRGPAAANQAIAHGRMAWRFAIDAEIVGVSRAPFDRHRLAAEPRKRHPITPADALAIWNVCESVLGGEPGPCSPVHAAYIQLVLLTGLRKREATHLRHDEFDRARGVLVIAAHKTSSATGAKVVPLSRAAAEHCARLQDQHRFDPVHFFPSARAKRGHIEDPLATWNRVRDAAGVPVGTIHDARRGFATTLHAAGVDLRQIQVLLGHASMSTTAKYVIPSTSTSSAASDRASDAILGKAVPR